MEKNLNATSSLFESIVALLESVFGFLPDWVLLFMGSAVLFSIAIFVYKLIRG